jgi:hypothetical protein
MMKDRIIILRQDELQEKRKMGQGLFLGIPLKYNVLFSTVHTENMLTYTF